MYFLVGRTFQNQSVFLRAFPTACRSLVAGCNNNNNNNNYISSGFTVSTSVGRRDYYKWTKPVTESKLLSTSKEITSLISKRQSSSGDHSTLWTAEKILSGALLPLIPITFLMPSAPLEGLLAFCLTLHSHWGIEAIVIDYVRPSLFGPVIPKIAVGAVYALSALTLGGLLYFIYSDVGLVTAVKMLWKL